MSDHDLFIGKKVRINEECNPYFNTGHVCVITRFDGGDYWADFNGQDNDFVNDDGVWCIGRETPRHFELIEN